MLLPRSVRLAFLYFVLVVLTAFASEAGVAQSHDRDICNRTFAYAFEHRLIDKTIGEIVAEIGKRFLDAPYLAGSLDSAGGEHLVVNLRGFDCVTFIENSLALARCIKGNTMAFDAYLAELERIRYRGGKQQGYASRLHYFLDWIADNTAKGVVEDVTREIGGVPHRKTINFMSTHRDRYPHLMADAAADSIREREKSISATGWYWVPRANVSALSGKIETGDIIAITTSVEGLDIGHTGIALKEKNGVVKLLHAPDVGKTVSMTRTTLAQYLAGHPKHTGVLIARPLNPPPR